MFQIINSFIDGEITDEQCKHCLAATNLGMQYILLSEKAVTQTKIIERCYIANNEKEYYKNIRTDDVLQLIDEEYGVSSYGSIKYTHNEMYWIGYL